LLQIRAGDVPTGQDRRFYDLGAFYLAVQGQNLANITLGELHVSYKVRLYKPQLLSQTIGTGQCAMFTFSPINNQPFTLPVEVNNQLGISFPSSTVLRFPKNLTGDFTLVYSTDVGETSGVFGYALSAGLEALSTFQAPQGLSPTGVFTYNMVRLSVRLSNTGVAAGVAQTVTITSYLMTAGGSARIMVMPCLNMH
jgi:hypothetical protein